VYVGPTYMSPTYTSPEHRRLRALKISCGNDLIIGNEI
jgi:hypothetical protein